MRLGNVTSCLGGVPAVLVAIALAGMINSSAALAQQTLPIEAFVGVWKGSGIASGESGYYLDETVRDLDVTIRASSGGFTIDWTTVVRKGPVGDRKVKRRETHKTFRPSTRPGVYRTASGGDLFAGGITWARLFKQTLTIYHLELNDQGEMELSRYDRTLVGGGMKLKFVRFSGVKPVRKVTGQLVKVGQ